MRAEPATNCVRALVESGALLQRATELAINDTAIVPLYHQVSLWGTRNGIGYLPRTDENTLAHKFRPAK